MQRAGAAGGAQERQSRGLLPHRGTRRHLGRRATLGCDPLFSRLPTQQCGLPFTLWVCMLMGMDNLKLYDAALDGGVEYGKKSPDGRTRAPGL